MRLLRATAAKVENAKEMIRRFRADHGEKAYLSCSFGKDSTVMLRLAQDVDPSIPVLWFDGGEFDELPETAGFADRLRREWGFRLVVCRPKKGLRRQWEEFGVPKKFGDPADREYHRQFIKAILGACRAEGWDAQFLGMRLHESPNRRMVLLGAGPVYQRKSDGLHVCNPLWNWTTREVWEVIDSMGVPYHPVYNQTAYTPREEIRLGVLAETCCHGKGAIMHMKRYYPGLFNELAGFFPELRTMT